MTAVPVLRHTAKSQDLVNRVQCRSFRMMITRNAAVALLLRLLRVWRIVLLDGALPSARNVLIMHSLSLYITGKTDKAHASWRKSIRSKSTDNFQGF